jgi:hypothetical protein
VSSSGGRGSCGHATAGRALRRLLVLAGGGLASAVLLALLGRKLHRRREPASHQPAHGDSPREAPASQPQGEPPHRVIAAVALPAAADSDPDPEETTTCCDLFRERLLILPSGQRALRSVVLSVMALIVTSGALIAVGPHLPSTPLLLVSVRALRSARISDAALVLALMCAALAWTLGIAGLFFSHWKVRLAGLALLALGAFAERRFFGGFSLFGSSLGLVALFGILVLGLLTIAADQWIQQGSPSQPVIRGILWGRSGLLAILVLTIFIYQAVRLGGPGTELGSISVLELLYATIILVLPMLILAGADVADFGCAIVGCVGRGLRQRRSSVLAGVSTIAAAGALVNAGRVLGGRIFAGVLLAVLFFTILALVIVAVRPQHRWKKPLPALIVAAILFALLISLQLTAGFLRVPQPSALNSDPPDAPYIHASQPEFSMLHPSNCSYRIIDDNPQRLTFVAFASCQLIRYLPTALNFRDLRLFSGDLTGRW